MRIVVAEAHGRPRNWTNLSTIKVSNSSFLACGFSVWFVNRQEIKRLELVYLESFLFELLETLANPAPERRVQQEAGRLLLKAGLCCTG